MPAATERGGGEWLPPDVQPVLERRSHFVLREVGGAWRLTVRRRGSPEVVQVLDGRPAAFRHVAHLSDQGLTGFIAA